MLELATVMVKQQDTMDLYLKINNKNNATSFCIYERNSFCYATFCNDCFYPNVLSLNLASSYVDVFISISDIS